MEWSNVSANVAVQSSGNWSDKMVPDNNSVGLPQLCGIGSAVVASEPAINSGVELPHLVYDYRPS